MVTASHNPPQDNGYKVYAADGAQIVPPTDSEIEAAIRSAGPARDIPRDATAAGVVDESVVSDYVAAVAALVPATPRDVRIVHTAMHGVGTETLRAVFHSAGFTDLVPVPEQELPDPAFPTVAFPNPEEPGALDLALALAADRDADLVLANDPDADRCAVAVPDAGGAWRMLRGDEVGVLLGDALLRAGVRGTYATTIVSSSMLGSLARAHGVGYAETLTGFKWIVRAAGDLVYGYEEALGYAVAPDLVRDKDGVSAALRVAHLAAELKAAGSSLLARLDELGRRARAPRHRPDLGTRRRPGRHRGDHAAATGRTAGDPARPPGCRRGPAAGHRRAALAGRGRPRRRPTVRYRAEAEGLPRGRRTGRIDGRRRRDVDGVA